MTDEEKKKNFEEQQFKKKWGKYLKLSPIIYNNKLNPNIGKAPKCNTKGPKKETSVVIETKKKKK